MQHGNWGGGPPYDPNLHREVGVLQNQVQNLTQLVNQQRTEDRAWLQELDTRTGALERWREVTEMRDSIRVKIAGWLLGGPVFRWLIAVGSAAAVVLTYLKPLP